MFRIAQQTPPGYKRWKRFTALCGCGATDHIQHIDLNVDEDYGIHMEIYSDGWFGSEKLAWGNIRYTLKKRFFAVIEIIFTGHIRVQSGFVFDDEQQIDDYIEAITNAKKELLLNAAKSREAAEATKDRE